MENEKRSEDTQLLLHSFSFTEDLILACKIQKYLNVDLMYQKLSTAYVQFKKNLTKNQNKNE